MLDQDKKARLESLRKKKEDGTLTNDEATELKTLEKEEADTSEK